MSNWPGKFVIGLTGNIGTGKSVVRKMLEHLGAYGIDADALAHRAMAKGAPGYKPVVDIFGSWILDPQGQIDRNKLGKLVFTDPGGVNQSGKYPSSSGIARPWTPSFNEPVNLSSPSKP